MKYVKITEENKKHLLKLIEFLYQEVLSAGGDGDALWYSRFYSIEDILPIINEYNASLKFKWSVEFDKAKNSIYWSDNQEYVVITNDIEVYGQSNAQCRVIL